MWRLLEAAFHIREPSSSWRSWVRAAAPALPPFSAPLPPGPSRAGGGVRSRGNGRAAAPLLTCHFVWGERCGRRGCGGGEPSGCPGPVSGTRGCAGKGSGTRPRSLWPVPACSLPSGPVGRGASPRPDGRHPGLWRWVTRGLFKLWRTLDHTERPTRTHHGELRWVLSVCVCVCVLWVLCKLLQVCLISWVF